MRFALPLLCFTSLLIAQDSEIAQLMHVPKQEKKISYSEPVYQEPEIEYDYVVMPPKEEYPFYLFGELLYWKPYQEGVPLAVTASGEQLPSIPVTGLSQITQFTPTNEKEHAIEYDFEPGWRAGIGFFHPHDDWNVMFYWTWLTADGSENLIQEGDRFIEFVWNEIAGLDGINAGLFFDGGVAVNPPIPVATPELHSRSRLHYNVADLDIGKFVIPSDWFSIRAAIGARAAWIREDIKMRYLDVPLAYYATNEGNRQQKLVGTVDDLVKLKNHFEGVGIRASLDSHWDFCSGWGLFGCGGIGLLYGKTEVAFKEHMSGQAIGPSPSGGGSASVPIDMNYRSADSFFGLKGVINLLLGVQWEKKTGWAKYHIHVAYELTDWLNQFEVKDYYHKNTALVPYPPNAFMSTVNTNTNSGPTYPIKYYSDLSFQGINVEAKMSF